MTDLYFFDSGWMLTVLSIAPSPVREDWRPTLQCAMASGGESRVVVAGPSLPWGALLGSVASTAVAMAMVLVVILVVMAEAALEVSLAALPPPAAAKEERETRLPALPGGGPHGSPSRSELEVPGGDAAKTELDRLPVAYETKVVGIPSDDEVGDEVKLPTPSQELVVVWSEAGPSSGLEETDLVWPCPEDPTKVWFVLWDS